MPRVLENIDSSGKKYFVEINTGEAENGVPVGGSTGQVLAKASNDDYDSEWVTPEGGNVDSVNGQTGIVVLDTDDVGEGINNKYLSATQKTDLTDGGETILHTHSHTTLNDIGTNTHEDIDTKLASLYNEREITKETTGFTNSENITVTYNETTRKVTLTGTFVAYYKGEVVSILTDGWVSPAHADVEGTYFLHYCDNGLEFNTSPWVFNCLQIAFIQYNGNKIGIRETHGFMQWQTHKEFHETIGTYKTAGGTFSDYTLNSTTATNRRPNISATTVRDEDLTTVINALTTKSYTQRYLSGAGVRSLTVSQSEIIAVNGAIPYWNQFNGTNWVQTPMTNNSYGAIFVVGIPTTSDTNSQLYRYMFVQPQTVGALVDIQSVTPNDLVHGDSSLLVSEFVFFAKIIINVSGNNWTITSIEDITGTRLNQTASPAGTYLASVTHDTTLTGDGTAINPLSAVEQKPTIYEVTSYAEFKTALEDTTQGFKNIFVNSTILNISSNQTITVSGINNVYNNCIFSGNYTLTLSGTGTINIYNKLYFEGSQISVNGSLYINVLQIGTYTMFVGTGIRRYQYVLDIDTIEGITQQNWFTGSDVYALKTNVLQLDNTTSFTPDADYEPATKKYVDDKTTGKSIFAIYEVRTPSEFKSALEDTSQDFKNIFINNVITLTEDITITPYGDITIYNNLIISENNIAGGRTITWNMNSDIVMYLYNGLGIIIPSNIINFDFTGDSGNKLSFYVNTLAIYGTLNEVTSSRGEIFYQYNVSNGTIELPYSYSNWLGTSYVKATGTEINTGTDDAKYVTSKAIADSSILYESDIVNALTSTSTTDGLSANMGKSLKSYIDIKNQYIKVYKNTTQSISATTATKLTFQAATSGYDSSLFELNTNGIKILSNRIKSIRADIFTQINSNQVFILYVYKNTTQINALQFPSNTSGYSTAVLDVALNDVIYFYIFSAGATTVTNSADWNNATVQILTTND